MVLLMLCCCCDLIVFQLNPAAGLFVVRNLHPQQVRSPTSQINITASEYQKVKGDPSKGTEYGAPYHVDLCLVPFTTKTIVGDRLKRNVTLESSSRSSIRHGCGEYFQKDRVFDKENGIFG